MGSVRIFLIIVCVIVAWFMIEPKVIRWLDANQKYKERLDKYRVKKKRK